jgi:hypothetical protein
MTLLGVVSTGIADGDENGMVKLRPKEKVESLAFSHHLQAHNHGYKREPLHAGSMRSKALSSHHVAVGLDVRNHQECEGDASERGMVTIF